MDKKAIALRLAKQQGCADVEYYGEWGEYSAFYTYLFKDKNRPATVGTACFILVNKQNKARMANYEESREIVQKSNRRN